LQAFVLVTLLSLALAQTAKTALITPAEAAGGECRALLDKKSYNQAIERCGEAARGDLRPARARGPEL
jgi:hypothetical protein